MTDVQIWQPQAAEIAVYEPTGPLDDWMRVADQVVRLAEVIANSPFVPDGLRGSVPAVAAAILTGRELKIPPMTSLANIHVIHGKPGLSALVMRALVLSQGHEWRDIEVNDTRVVLEGRRKGASEWTRASFSTADAQTARLQLGGYPQDKLYARATSRLARRAFADVIAGMPYSIEELEDGITGDEPTPTAPAGEQPKPAAPRTARRAAPRTASPAPPAPSPASAPPPPAQSAGEALPPLPGEEEITAPVSGGEAREAEASKAGSPDPGRPDERDYDSFGTVTTAQLTAIWTVLSQVYHFGADEKDQARGVCAQILGVELTTSTALSKNQAGTVIDTLAHWQEQARAQGEEPRGYLMLMLQSAREAAGGE